LVDEVFSKSATSLSDVSRESILALVRYFKLDKKVQFMNQW